MENNLWVENENIQMKNEPKSIENGLQNTTKLTKNELEKKECKDIGDLKKTFYKIKEGKNHWTGEEIKFLKDFFDKFSTEELANILGRGKRTTELKLQSLKLFRIKHWTEKEISILIEKYPELGSIKILNLLPGRTKNQIGNKAYELGIEYSINYQYLGKKFGRLLVEERLDNKGKFTRWKCLCDCGKNVITLGTELLKGRVRSCGCLAKQINESRCGNKSPKWKGIGLISGKMYNRMLSNARCRRLECNISHEYISKLFNSQLNKCAISGLEIKISTKPGETTASLDRIDSSKGYIENNVQWVHKDINRMKWEFSDEKFINYCKIIANYNK